MRVSLVCVIDDSTPTRKLLQTQCPPLGLLSLQAFVHAQRPTVEVVVSYALDEALAHRPDVIGLSAVTENFGRAAKLAEQIKSWYPVPVLIGGSHISLLPHLLPPSCDVGVLGEGELTLLELLDLFAAEGEFAPDRLARIAGVAFHDPTGTVQRTARRELVSDLDTLPFPHRSELNPQRITHLISSRGCPYSCAFCSSPTIWRGWRMHSAGYVVDELEWIQHNLAPAHVKFFDDLFIANTRRLRGIADGIVERGLGFSDGMGCFARTDLIDDALMPVLARMGMTYLYLGIESGSQEALQRLAKRSTVEQNQRALDLCHASGIRTCCSFVIGAPGETAAQLDETLAFIERNADKITEIEICPAVPFPGTALWSQALQQGLVSEVMDWSRLKDHISLSAFSLDDYIYLNPAMPLRSFEEYVRRFAELYQRISTLRDRVLAVGT